MWHHLMDNIIGAILDVLTVHLLIMAELDAEQP
jgi:hypothetical protein